MNDIIVKTYTIETMKGDFIPLNEEQSAKVISALTSANAPKFLKIGNDIIATHQIIKIAQNTSDNLQKLDENRHKARGEWKCSRGLWHSKQYKECSCEHHSSYSRAKEKQIAGCEFCLTLMNLK